jgi:anti-sigma regulatory factor (Ser/Thr protein kinase)
MCVTAASESTAQNESDDRDAQDVDHHRDRATGSGMMGTGVRVTEDQAAGPGAAPVPGAERARAAHAARVGAENVHDWTALALPASPRAAGHFRRHAVNATHRWGLHPDSGDLVEICVSELVTNAIVHGVGRDVLMMLYYTGDSVLTEVFGHALDEPVIPATARSDNAESGRGLLIVETLAKDWGSEHTGLGLLRVWASIAVFGGRTPG